MQIANSDPKRRYRAMRSVLFARIGKTIICAAVAEKNVIKGVGYRLLRDAQHQFPNGKYRPLRAFGLKFNQETNGGKPAILRRRGVSYLA
jgi:hypothetical protein